MKIFIISFSDLHFHFIDESNSIGEKKQKLINALKSRINQKENDRVLLIMNGDIAFSGKESEYDKAFDFFSDLVSCFNNCDFFCVPGNHDCDFDTIKAKIKYHEFLISDIKKSGQLTDDSIEVLEPQNNFKNFSQIFTDAWKNSKIIFENQLVQIIDYNISKTEKIRINLLNSAWDSSIHEQPGTMYFPIEQLENIKRESTAILNISAVHHPTNWLEPNNKIKFEEKLKKNSDFILVGHEHQNTVESLKNRNVETIILETSVLQENDNPDISGFGIITIDYSKNEKKIELEKFMWNTSKGLYCSQEPVENLSERITDSPKFSISVEDNFFVISNKMNKYNNELGAPIYHPKLGELSLDDIYVYPDFKNSLSGKEKDKNLKAENLMDKIVNTNGLWFIAGAKESGKTSFLKKIFIELSNNKIVPLLIDAQEIKNKDDIKKLNKIIKKKYQLQYNKETFESFRQLENHNKILLIDNWELCKLNNTGKEEIISEFSDFFSKIVIVTESAPNNSSDILSLKNKIKNSITFLEIKRFGHKKREEIIEKWLKINDDYSTTEQELIERIDQYTKQVNEVIGKSYVPQLPIYILIILQSIDGGKELTDFNKKTNGYYYEVLIKQVIMSISENNNDISTMLNYLSHLAYKIFSNNKKSLNYDEWNKLHDTYIDNYELDKETMNFNNYQQKLLKSRIIKRFNNERFSFSYNYFLYYFTAQYFSDNVAEDLIKGIILDLIENINIELNANILIFLTHLSKDSFILQSVIKQANSLLLDQKELTMESDIQELNGLMTELPTLIFKSATTRENRDKYNEVKDLSEKDKSDEHFLDEDKKDKTSNDSLVEKSEILIEMDKAQRISELIGQVLKNYSGSIDKDTKRSLIDSAYNVSLRAGNTLIEIVKEEKDDLIAFVVEKIIEDGNTQISEHNKNEVETAAKKVVFQFVEMISFSIIQKIISDTGTSALKPTYEKLEQTEMSTAKKLIICGSYLETIYVNPKSGYIRNIFDNSKKNLIAQSILRDMVAKYMYLFELPTSERQSIGEIFRIDYQPVIHAKIKSQQ